MFSIRRLLPLVLILGTGCPSVDDSDTADTDVPTADTDAPPAQSEEALQRSWVSQGDDLSGVLVFSGVASVDAAFNADGTYDVVSTDGEGAATQFTGTYVVDLGTTPPSITLTQDVPYAAVAEGIWQVEADGSLTYEVTQTTPDLGFAPATPEGGFGSTSGSGLLAGANVQTYR